MMAYCLFDKNEQSLHLTLDQHKFYNILDYVCLTLKKFFLDRAKFNDIYILKIDLLHNIVALKSLSYDITAAPTLISITDEGEVTHDLIDGGAWEEDTPENIAAALQPFFERVTSNK